MVSRALRYAIVLVSILIALGHTWWAQIIFRSAMIGGYFLIATILFLVGGVLAWRTSGAWFRFANLGLILLAILDNALIYYTRTVPSMLSMGRVFSWSAGWWPTGAVQVFVAQSLLIVLSGYALLRGESAGSA
ncbi:MAG TPA: hypothetical protein VE862_02470 [Candidatus Acidoferrum sp.]|nr:hypothetical protein [Candidatus Acidoferrum sp.]